MTTIDDRTTRAACRKMLTFAEAAEQERVCTQTIRRMVARGDLPAYRLGRSRILRIDQADLDALYRRVDEDGAA